MNGVEFGKKLKGNTKGQLLNVYLDETENLSDGELTNFLKDFIVSRGKFEVKNKRTAIVINTNNQIVGVKLAKDVNKVFEANRYGRIKCKYYTGDSCRMEIVIGLRESLDEDFLNWLGDEDFTSKILPTQTQTNVVMSDEEIMEKAVYLYNNNREMQRYFNSRV